MGSCNRKSRHTTQSVSVICLSRITPKGTAGTTYTYIWLPKEEFKVDPLIQPTTPND